MKQVGDEYFDDEEFREILAEYENANSIGDSIFLDADDLTDIADYYAFIGDDGKASEAINTALDKFPGAAGPLVYKAREALKNEDLNSAYHFAEQIDEKDSPDYTYIQAEILIAQDRIDEADAILKEYNERIDSDNDFLLDCGELYIDYGVYDKAYEWLTLIEERDFTEYKELMGRASLGIGKYDESIEIFTQLLDENPYSKVYWHTLATAQMLKNELEDAVNSVGYAIAIDPNDSACIQTKANCLFKLENYEEALTYYLRFCDLEPSNDGGELNVGSCLVNLSRNEEAIAHLKIAERIADDDSQNLPYIYEELAFAYDAKEQRQKALEYIDKASKYDYDHTDIDILRGHILLKDKQIVEAQKAFWEVIRNSNFNPQVMLRVTVSIYDNQYLGVAYRLFKKLFSIVPDDFSDGYSYMALCCRDMKKPIEFLRYLLIATTVNPREAKRVLGFMFPEGTHPEEYYDYLLDKTNNKK